MKRWFFALPLLLLLALAACNTPQAAPPRRKPPQRPPAQQQATPPANRGQAQAGQNQSQQPPAGTPQRPPRPTPTAAPAAAPSPVTAQVWWHSPLGVAFGPFQEGNARRPKMEGFLTYIHDLGIPRTKLSFYWSNLEPEPGKYDFHELDAYLDQLQPDDQALLNLFTNGWCTTADEVKSQKGAPLRECPQGQTTCTKTCEEYYREFVTKVAEEVRDHAHGGIKYMQRDTEPASGLHFPADQPEAFVQLQHIYYQAVKAVLPEVQVIGVNCNGDFTKRGMGEPASADFFEYVLQYGKDDFDLLDVRLYNDLYAIPNRVGWFREHMQKYGYEKPIVSTEYGGVDPRTLHNGKDYLFMAQIKVTSAVCGENQATRLKCARQWAADHVEQVDPKLRPFFGVTTPEEQAQYEQLHCYDIVQRSIVALGEGVQALWMWNLQSPGVDLIFGQMRLRTPQMEELPGYACYKRFAGHMGNATKVERIATGDDSIYFYRIEREGQQPLFIAWHHSAFLDPYDDAAAPAVTVALPVPLPAVSVTDALGNPVQASLANGQLTLALTSAPVFIEPGK